MSSYWNREGRKKLHIRFDGGNIDGCQYEFSRASAGSYTDENGILQKLGAGVDVPRFESLPSLQFPDVSGSGKLYLHETSKTNYILQSEDFTASNWTKTGVTVTSNQMTAPDNTVTADKLAGATVGDKVEQTVSATTSKQYCFSVWLKADSNVTVTIELEPDGTGPTIGSQTCNVTTSWKRFKVKTMTVSDSTVITARIITDANTVYAWGAQLEYEDMTSYIPTTTVATSRADDTFKIFMLGFDHNNFIFRTRLTPLYNFTEYSARGIGTNYIFLWGIPWGTSYKNAQGYFLQIAAENQPKQTIGTDKDGAWQYGVSPDTAIVQYSELYLQGTFMNKHIELDLHGGNYVNFNHDGFFANEFTSESRHWMQVGNKPAYFLIKEIEIEIAQEGQRI